LNTIEWGKKFYGMQEVIGSTPIFSTLIIKPLRIIVEAFLLLLTRG
jgi:hypothetical protein